MRLATRGTASPDGQLVVVSDDGARCLPAGSQWPTLLGALEAWHRAEPALRSVAARLEGGEGEPLVLPSLCSPLPRSWQWLDGSAFAVHAELMRIAFSTPRIETDKPLMYQGLSDRFYGPYDDVPFVDTAHGIDFEGEYAVIVDEVPMGTKAAAASQHIKLLVQLNDWSLRMLAVPEMKTGFGWIQAKPACSMAPFAVTPDQLGSCWAEARVAAELHIDWNGTHFGEATGREMGYGFDQLIEHAAATRDLVAGTIIGSGTIANADYARVGSSCISERRAIEIIAGGKPLTAFMAFGDRVRMQAQLPDGSTPFGYIDQVVVRAQAR